MVKWDVIGYFAIGLIIDIICRICDELNKDEFHYEPIEQGYYIFIGLFWPLTILAFIVIAIHLSIVFLSKYIAKKITERRKHEQAKD